MQDDKFLYTKYLAKYVDVVIDRPLGSKHPNCELIFTLNYGYIPGTRAGDGEEIDVYILDIDSPKHEITGKCIAIICRFDDNENKLIVVAKDIEYSDDEIMKLISFNEKFFDSIVIRTQAQYELFLNEKTTNHISR